MSKRERLQYQWGGLSACMRRPQQLLGPHGMSVRARTLRSQRLLFLNNGHLPRVRACALVSPFRFQKPLFSTWGSSALQHRGPSPGGSPSWASPAAPCALLMVRCGMLRTRAWRGPAYNGLIPRLGKTNGLGWLARFVLTDSQPPIPIALYPFVSANEMVVGRAESALWTRDFNEKPAMY
jgi:hypothetical protein